MLHEVKVKVIREDLEKHKKGTGFMLITIDNGFKFLKILRNRRDLHGWKCKKINIGVKMAVAFQSLNSKTMALSC